MNYEGKNVVVTGGTGMIGRFLVEKLVSKGARVLVISMDEGKNLPPSVRHLKVDLTDINKCLDVCEGADYVFHLAGIKGSPKMAKEQPASFMIPTIMFNTNMLEAARRKNVKRFMYTSSVGVYSPSALLSEDDVWKTFPSDNDKYAGWAKRMGELQAEAYKVQYGIDTYRIVRPTNIYGPNDNFDPANAMVIPSLIARVASGENPLKVWGDGSQVRDFLYGGDCADGMIKIFESDELRPVNLGTGNGNTIKEIVELVIKYSANKPEVIWDTSKPSGDKIRVLDTKRAEALGFKATTLLEEGVRQTIDWYRENKGRINEGRYNVFSQGLGR